jgi:GTP-binding protein
MFIDHVKITVKAGKGGNGCLSFHREKFLPKGGPDGGNGGVGGSVYFKAVESKDTLIDFSGRPLWQAKNGQPGQGANKTGPDGDDMVIEIPVGTVIHDAEYDLILKDMNKPGMQVCICKGGRFGLGNKMFATSTNQAPRKTTEGKPGEQRKLRLELKLIADVGLVGKPNAGKSTLVSRCSAAKPKIADYPFTTLEPVLGIVELSDYRRFVMADIPGLIEGAHEGAGLGHDFLKHIERTRVILHLVDIMPTDGSDPVENYRVICRELHQHSQKLAAKPQIVVLNKGDLDPTGEITADIKKRLKEDIITISAVTGQNLDNLKEMLWKNIRELKDTEEQT